MEIAEVICERCPFRRDTKRRGDIVDLIRRHVFPGFQPYRCKKAVCLGWIVFLQNQSCAIQIRDEVLRKEIWSWSTDVDTIFGGAHEMLRYHRGEWFGSEDWRLNWRARFHSDDDSPSQGESLTEAQPPAQGELF